MNKRTPEPEVLLDEVTVDALTVVLTDAGPVEATLGDVAVRANGAVKLDGEEALMNCDANDEVPPWMRDTLGAQLTKAPATPAAEVQGDASRLGAWERRPQE